MFDRVWDDPFFVYDVNVVYKKSQEPPRGI